MVLYICKSCFNTTDYPTTESIPSTCPKCGSTNWSEFVFSWTPSPPPITYDFSHINPGMVTLAPITITPDLQAQIDSAIQNIDLTNEPIINIDIPNIQSLGQPISLAGIEILDLSEFNGDYTYMPDSTWEQGSGTAFTGSIDQAISNIDLTNIHYDAIDEMMENIETNPIVQVGMAIVGAEELVLDTVSNVVDDVADDATQAIPDMLAPLFDFFKKYGIYIIIAIVIVVGLYLAAQSKVFKKVGKR